MPKKAIKYIFCNKVIINVFDLYIYVFGLKGFLKRSLYLLNYYIICGFGNLYLYPVYVSKSVYILWSTYYTVIYNIVNGVTFLYSRILIILGVGYWFKVIGNLLCISIGYSHLIKVFIPSSIFVNLFSSTKICFNSVDNICLGNFCSYLIFIKKYNYYSNKGIRDINFIPVLKKIKK